MQTFGSIAVSTTQLLNYTVQVGDFVCGLCTCVVCVWSLYVCGLCTCVASLCVWSMYVCGLSLSVGDLYVVLIRRAVLVTNPTSVFCSSHATESKQTANTTYLAGCRKNFPV